MCHARKPSEPRRSDNGVRILIHNAPNINHLWSRLVIEELRRNGVDTFYISPGSRSTPLTVAAAQTEGVETYVHFDERGAAFAALGHAMGSERPAVVICTSGTAAANYLPAIVEASQSGVPLIVLTADRPPELTDTGANQAINQIGLYKNFVRWEHALPCPTTDMPAQALLTAVDQACYRAQGHDPGPVHINCAFREPLAPTNTGDDWTEYLVPLERWLGTDEPFTRYAELHPALSGADTETLDSILANTERGLLVVGRLTLQADRDAAVKIASALQWPVFADIASGVRALSKDSTFIPHYDLLLASERYRSICRPDTVIHLGGGFVSKRLLQHLESVRAVNHVHIANTPRRDDPGHITTLHLQSRVADVLHYFESNETFDTETWRLRYSASDHNSWVGQHIEPMTQVVELLATRNYFVPGGPVTEPAILNRLLASAHADDSVFIGNSLPIRAADAFLPETEASIVANRGASGIDGNIATAAGLARGSGRKVTAIVGDLTALHDLNALALLRDTQHPVTLVVINNDGGGIFHFLPIGDNEEVFEEYFGTPHGLTFEHAANQFGIDYHAAATLDDLVQMRQQSLGSGRSAIIEVRTDRHENHRLQLEIIDAVRKALDEGDA